MRSAAVARKAFEPDLDLLCHNLTLISVDAFSKKMMEVRAPLK
jgi:hypothetical protein